MQVYDVIIIGAGAAGLMAANVLYQRKKSFLILDLGDKPARKIAVSGGGKCNFTNSAANYTRYFGTNSNFTRSALSQFSPLNTLEFIQHHHIQYTEPEPGRFFCKNSAIEVIDALLKDIHYKTIKTSVKVTNVVKQHDIFVIETESDVRFEAKSVIVATGGLSYANLGVSNVGQTIAKQFGHKIIPIRPALCALKTSCFSASLSGISIPVEINIEKTTIKDNLLFTHFGIGGPATYKASLFDISKPFYINFLPNIDILQILKQTKQTNGKKTCAGILSEYLPNNFVKWFIGSDTKHIADYKDADLQQIVNKLTHFQVADAKTTGLNSAEVTFGGIDTSKISSKTMESQLCSGLFFAGEVLDITGDLGGFNLQWAFSSGFVAGSNA